MNTEFYNIKLTFGVIILSDMKTSYLSVLQTGKPKKLKLKYATHPLWEKRTRHRETMSVVPVTCLNSSRTASVN